MYCPSVHGFLFFRELINDTFLVQICFQFLRGVNCLVNYVQVKLTTQCLVNFLNFLIFHSEQQHSRKAGENKGFYTNCVL